MTKYIYHSSALLFCASFLWPAAATASVVFSNFGPSATYDTANFNIVGNDNVGDNLAQGDVFQPLATAKFGDLQIALSCFNSCPDSFTVSLNQDNGSNSPGTVIESFNRSGLLLGPTGVNNAPLVFTSLLQPTLTAGTRYWITAVTDLNNAIAFGQNITGDTSDEAISTDGGATYFSPSFLTPGAFEVDSAQLTDTPEPGTLILFAGGLPLVAVIRRTVTAARKNTKLQ